MREECSWKNGGMDMTTKKEKQLERELEIAIKIIPLHTDSNKIMKDFFKSQKKYYRAKK